MFESIVFLVIGLLIGGLIGWLIARRNSSSSSDRVDVQNLNRELDELRLVRGKLEGKLENAEESMLKLETSLQRQEQRVNEQTGEIQRLEAEKANLQQRLKEQLAEVEKLNDKFKNDFKVLAQEILDKTGATFKEQNREQIGQVLNPFKERLEKFEKKVEETYEKSRGETISLKTEVKALSEQSAKLSKDADNLSKALRGDVKAQGNWGEVVLERILEKSGLTRDQEYFIQQSFTSEEGKRLQPDVIIKLPEEKNIIVDAKVSLVAYERFANADTKEEQEAAVKEHINSIKVHVKGLSEKNYQQLYDIEGLDFVLLFIPIEGAFTIAVQQDHQLFQDAFDKNVVIVSTSTLLATLRTIASIWKQEKQTQNAIEIARQGAALYDKFVSLTEDLVKLGNQMKTAQGTYGETMKKLSEGKGNLVKRAEDMRKLGLKTSKQMDQKLIDRASDEE